MEGSLPFGYIYGQKVRADHGAEHLAVNVG
jgi:hypothetical protein